MSVNAWIVSDKTKAPSEKSSIMTNRKSPTSFPRSLRWTAYVAPNPQRGPQKRIFFHFPYKNGLCRRKSATKFLCVKTFSGRLVRHSLAYLSVHKWLVRDVPLYLKFWIKLTQIARNCNQRFYLLQQLRKQGLSDDCLKVLCFIQLFWVRFCIRCRVRGVFFRWTLQK